MKVLIYGGGAREHAIAWKVNQSPLLTKLYLAKPNDGFSNLGEIIEFSGFVDLADTARQEGIDLLIVGPEDPLVNGIVDEFKKVNIPAIGPGKDWAMLEGSKAFAKKFMKDNDIPTGEYLTINKKSEIDDVLNQFSIPVVVKADGLAAGKGVFIAQSKKDAKRTIEEFLDGKFGEASKNIVVEEFLEGDEISLISLWDGETLLPMIPARDYKRLLDSDRGPNTGGMGAYCPVELKKQEQSELSEYINKLEVALKREKADFAGVIYSGLILTKDGIKILEYNMRFGDPETQPLLMHLDSDLLVLFVKAARKQLKDIKITWKNDMTLCVVVAAEGYPFSSKNGGCISNIKKIEKKHGVQVFYAGIKLDGSKLIANGGRILSICKTGDYPHQDVYKAAEELEYIYKYYRKDIAGKVGETIL